MKILLLESNKELAEATKLWFENAGHEVEVAFSAQQAVYCAENSPAVIVMELALPVHNGLEFLYELRSHQDWAGIPVVIYSRISAETADLSQDIMHRLGIVDHLYKPTTTFKKLESVVAGAVFEPSNR